LCTRVCSRIHSSYHYSYIIINPSNGFSPIDKSLSLLLPSPKAKILPYSFASLSTMDTQQYHSLQRPASPSMTSPGSYNMEYTRPSVTTTMEPPRSSNFLVTPMKRQTQDSCIMVAPGPPPLCPKDNNVFLPPPPVDLFLPLHLDSPHPPTKRQRQRSITLQPRRRQLQYDAAVDTTSTNTAFQSPCAGIHPFQLQPTLPSPSPEDNEVSFFMTTRLPTSNNSKLMLPSLPDSFDGCSMRTGIRLKRRSYGTSSA